MLPTNPVLLAAAASEAADEPKRAVDDGKAKDVPKVRSEAEDACERVVHSCTPVQGMLGGEQAKLFKCSTPPRAARRTTSPTSFEENGSLSLRLQNVDLSLPPDSLQNRL